MKNRLPLRNLLITSFVALAMVTGFLSPLSAARADPVVTDTDTEIVAEAQSMVAARGLASMRLQKSTGQWVSITPQMQTNALVVINTIRSTSWAGVTDAEKDRLITIALMTMAQESTFYANPSAVRPDRNQDVGPFQQRSKVGWYADGATQAENIRILNNIPYATRTFIEGHRVPRAVPGGAGPAGYVIPGVFQMKGSKDWRTAKNLWEVAANVQRPAAKYRYYYEHWRPVVQAMVAVLEDRAVEPFNPADVYTTVGERVVNGRQWRTTCGSYTDDIDRCRAEIWSTTVTRVNGKYVQKNDWNFNNLTYLPSPRSLWKSNPLALPGPFTSDGRQWKSSCADSWTGPNACRSFIKVKVIEPYLDGGGSRQFRDVEKWVFNNIVQFSD